MKQLLQPRYGDDRGRLLINEQAWVETWRIDQIPWSKGRLLINEQAWVETG